LKKSSALARPGLLQPQCDRLKARLQRPPSFPWRAFMYHKFSFSSLLTGGRAPLRERAVEAARQVGAVIVRQAAGATTIEAPSSTADNNVISPALPGRIESGAPPARTFRSPAQRPEPTFSRLPNSIRDRGNQARSRGPGSAPGHSMSLCAFSRMIRSAKPGILEGCSRPAAGRWAWP
jgi:hypothetical protein